MARVFGIDPGSHRTGWGVLSACGTEFTYEGSGTIQAPEGALAVRLRAIGDALDELLTRYRPDAIAVEAIFHAQNSQSALRLGQARGVALLCAARSGAPVFEYTAGQIKQALSGRGRASKDQVQAMVRVVLACPKELGWDASDALAAAICHVQFATSWQHARVLGTACTGSAEASEAEVVA
jgi:crossover junction endodeoxyribonuclease RuvC